MWWLLVVIALGAGGYWFWQQQQKQESGPKPHPLASDMKKAPAMVETSAPRKRVNWLIGVDGEHAGATFHIGNRQVTVGRGAGNFIQINDTDISRVHAQIRPSGDGVEVLDMKSSNGTFVNGERVPRKLLVEGDLLRIGTCELRYQRNGDFSANAALGRKDAGADTVRATQMAQGGVGGLQAMAQEALRAAGGDHVRAAQAVGLKVEDFKRVLEGRIG